MFKIESRDLASPEARLLFNIQELLIELIPKKIELIPKKHETKRSELIAKVKGLPNKPKAWTRLSNDELLKLLERRC